MTDDITIAEDPYVKTFGKTEEQVWESQQELVNHTLLLAFKALYAHSASQGIHVDPTITITKKEKGANTVYSVTLENTNLTPCKTAEEALAALMGRAFNEGNRVSAFNQIAKANGFDLSLKTAGHKSIGSTKEKMDKKGIAPFEIKDVLRLTVISGQKDILDTFADELRVSTGQELPQVYWKMNNRATLTRAEQFKMGELGAEVQFVPREQSHAMRLSHPFYQVPRSFDAYKKLLVADKKAEVIKKYNTLADISNTLLSYDILPQDYYKTVNLALATEDMDTMTFDEGGENAIRLEGSGKVTEHKVQRTYSPILKNQGDLLKYRKYLREVAQKVSAEGKEPAFPLPKLSSNSSDDDIDNAMQKLRIMSQLIHACDMQNATIDMRKLWVTEALEVNHIEPGVIPESILWSVCMGDQARGCAFSLQSIKEEMGLDEGRTI